MQGHAGPLGQVEFSPVGGAFQFQIAGVADNGRQLEVVEEGAIAVNQGPGDHVFEAPGAVAGRVAQHQRVAGGKGGVQREAAETQALVVEYRPGPGDAELEVFEVVAVGKAQRVERAASFVSQREPALHLHGAGFGREVHLQADGRYAGLGRPFEALVLLFVVGLHGLVLVLGRVVVAHRHVVVNPGTQAQPGQQGGGGHCPQRRAKRLAQLRPAEGAAHGPAPHPQPHREGRQQHGECGPIELKPYDACRERPEAVHVGVGEGRRVGEAQQVVVPVQGVAADALEQDNGHRQAIGQELIAQQYVQKHRTHCHHHVAGELDAEHGLAVQTPLEVGVALQGLRRHAHQHAHGREQGGNGHQRQQFGRVGHPRRARRRIQNAVEPGVLLFPHQRPAVVHQHGHHKQPVSAVNQVEHGVGDGEEVPAFPLRSRGRDAEQVEHAYPEQYPERHALENA